MERLLWEQEVECSNHSAPTKTTEEQMRKSQDKANKKRQLIMKKRGWVGYKNRRQMRKPEVKE